jgi:hypothetical protein
LFVTATDVWRLHLERGQMYVFNLFALSAAIAWSECGKQDSVPAGIALGVLALLRPNLIVIAPALLILRQWRMSGSMLATVGAGVAVTALMLPMSSWSNYLAVGDQYYRSIQSWDSIPDLTRPLHEGPVEGVQFGYSLRNVESSSFALLYLTLQERLDWPTINLALASKIAMGGLAALLLAIVWRRRGDVQSAFALLIVLALDTEFFLPHRWGYVDVMLLAPMALLLPVLLRSNCIVVTIVVIGLLSGPIGQQFFGLYAATVLRSWLVMGGLTWLALRSNTTR